MIVGFAGCAQTSLFERSALPVPNQWPDKLGTASRLSAAKTHWRTYFSDPVLQSLIATALKNNRDLRVAAGRVQEARAQFGIARADLGPTVNVMGSGSVTRTSSDLSGIGAPLTSQRYDLSMSSVSFEVDFWGRVANLSEAARLSYLASEESRRSVYVSLVADVALSYLTLLQFQYLVASEQSVVDLRVQSLALIEKGYAAGAANDFDYQQASSLVASSQASLASYVYQRDTARHRLDFLLGYAPVDLKLNISLDRLGLDNPVATGLPAEVLLLRPDVMAAEQRLRATHANIAAARAAFLPKVMLTTSLGLASQSLMNLFSGGAWSFQPLITMPLFDGGRTSAGVDAAKARNFIAVAEYERTIQAAFREVSDLLSSNLSLSIQVKSSKSNIQARARHLEIATGRYDAGAGTYLEVLDAQQNLISAQQSGAQVRRAQLESNVQLYKALGGGLNPSS